MKITLEQFCNQWRQIVVTKFEFALFDFASQAGELTKERFKTSFTQGGFYGSGLGWPERTSRWGRRFTHPVMIDTGTLSRAIQGEMKERKYTYRDVRKRISKRYAQYNIYTNESSHPIRGKRGRNKGRRKSYAAIHNADPKLHSYTVNQYSSRKPVRRQFIGFSPKIDDEVALLIPNLFENLPLKS